MEFVNEKLKLLLLTICIYAILKKTKKEGKMKISKNIFKMACTSALMTAAMFALPVEKAKAAGIQVFTNMSYFNPADMDFVDNFKFSAGAGMINLKSKFTGTQAGFPGTSKSNTYTYFPYGQAIYRIPCHKKLVVGVDVSNPAYVNFHYKSSNLSGTQTSLVGRNFSPKASYQVLENLTLGLGLDILYVANGKLGLQTPFGVSRFKGHGSTFGWDAGFLWKIVKGSYLSGSYHSKMKVQAHGFNTLANVTNFSSVGAAIPDTFTLNYLQYFSKNWLVNFNGRYVLWKKAAKSLILRNFAVIGTTTIPLNYKNAWVGQIYTRYQFACQWAALGFVEYDSNPQPKRFRPISLPADQVWIGGLGIQYLPTPNIETQLSGGVAFSNPKLVRQPTVGKDKIRAPFVDVRFTYKF